MLFLWRLDSHLCRLGFVPQPSASINVRFHTELHSNVVDSKAGEAGEKNFHSFVVGNRPWGTVLKVKSQKLKVKRKED